MLLASVLIRAVIVHSEAKFLKYNETLKYVILSKSTVPHERQCLRSETAEQKNMEISASES